MNASAFDTLAWYKRMADAEMPGKPARIQAEAMKEILDGRIVARDCLDLRLKKLKSRSPVRLGGIVAACAAILLAHIQYALKLKPAECYPSAQNPGHRA